MTSPVILQRLRYYLCEGRLVVLLFLQNMSPLRLGKLLLGMDETTNFLCYLLKNDWVKRCNIRVGWWISKVGDIGVKWKLLGIETAVVKGFFSKIIILDNKWLLKIAKKMRKCIFLFNGPELERVLVFRPPLFFDFRGGHTSSILSKSCSFLRYAFLELEFIIQNNDFWEKSFYYSSFYT